MAVAERHARRDDLAKDVRRGRPREEDERLVARVTRKADGKDPLDGRRKKLLVHEHGTAEEGEVEGKALQEALACDRLSATRARTRTPGTLALEAGRSAPRLGVRRVARRDRRLDWACGAWRGEATPRSTRTGTCASS